MPDDVQIGTDQQPDGPVTVQYPSGHSVQFPTEAHANEHAASVWDQLKSEWNTVKNFKGLSQPDEGDAFGKSVIDHVKAFHDKANAVLDEAGASLGRVPAEILSGAKNFQAMMPSPYGQKPSMESLEDTAKREHPILSGVGQETGRVAGSLLSPENVAIMATMPYAKAVPLLSQGLSAAFAAGMGKGVLDVARQSIANWPKMTPQQKTAALTSGALQTVLAGLATIHAVGGEGSKVEVPDQLKGESGEMTIPGTGGAAPARVGSAEAAAKDTQYFKEAKEENPEGSFSDWARIAQEKKVAAAKAVVPPVRELTAEDKAAAASAPDVNEKGQKLGIKPIEGLGNPPVIEKAGHPDYNEKGQRLGIPPEVEDIGGKARAGIPGILNLLKGETGEAKIPFTGMMDEDETGPIWFSRAEGTIAEKISNNMSGQAIRSALINNGIKPDEMKWSGLDEYLKDKPKVSKTDLQNFIAENKLKLNEVTYGGLDRDTQALRAQHEKLANLQDLAIQKVDGAYGRLESPVPMETFLSGTPGERAKWLSRMTPDIARYAQQYEQLEEQRSNVAQEMTGLKLNVNLDETKHAGATMYDVVNPNNGLTMMTGDRHAVNEYMNEHSELMKKQVVPKYEKWVVPGEKTKYTEKLLTLPTGTEDKYVQAKKAYEESLKSGSLDLASLRHQQDLFNAMKAAQTDRRYIAPHFQQEPNPNIVAHVRYSDRPAVDGKKTMFLEEAQSDWHTDIRHKGYAGEYAENAARIKELQAQYAAGQPLSDANRAELTKLADRNDEIFEAGDDKTPNAPFHQSWHELAMKRMLREAAEKGYDRLAWTTGQQQADLYSLGRHFASIEYEPDTKTLVIHEHNGKTHREDVGPTVKDLTPWIGRDLAENLAGQIENHDPGSSEDSLYESYAQSYDVQPIEQEPEYVINFPEHGTAEYFDSEREAEKYLKKWWEEKYPYHDPETGEWIAPEEGEERENDDDHDDIKPPTIDPQEREPEYGIYYDGDLVDSGYESSREAERSMRDRINQEVQDEMSQHESENPSISGLDLKRGGEFHKLLYDTMIPSFLKKYGKKWGAEVKDVEMKGMGAGKNVYEGPDLSLKDFDEKVADVYNLTTYSERDRLAEIRTAMLKGQSFTEAMNHIAQTGPKGIHDMAERFGGKIVAQPSHERVHSIEITPQMRRSVLKGQPIAKKEDVEQPQEQVA